MFDSRRDQMICTHMQIVGDVVAHLIASGQPAHIEADDLRQIGYVELIRTIDATPNPKGITLELRIRANVRRQLIRELTREAMWRKRAVSVEDYDDVC